MVRARHLSRLDWISAGLSTLAALAIYLATLAPTVTMEYSGALVVAADHLGVARPPGYPVWTLLANGFIRLFPFATYHGHPNPAWAVNCMSAVFGALSCGLLALLTCRLSRELIPDHRDSPLPRAVAGISAALLFACSPAMWSQAVIAETHTLTTFAFLLLLAASLRWMALGRDSIAFPLALLFGLGLSISPMLLAFAPLLLLAAAFVSRQALARMAFAILLFLGFRVAEFLWGRTHPSRAAAVLGAVLLLLLLFAAFRPARSAAILLALLLAGLLPYLYLPLASARNPPMDMGCARAWEGFWHVVGRGQYEAMAPANPFAQPLAFARQILWYGRLAAAQFTAPLAALALIPLAGLPWMPRHARQSIWLILAALFCFSIGVLIGANPRLDIQNTFVVRVVFIPSFALLALLCGLALRMLLLAFPPRRPGPPPCPSAGDAASGPAVTVN